MVLESETVHARVNLCADSNGVVSLSGSSLYNEIQDTHILTNIHTTDAIPSIRLWADTIV